MIKLIGGGRHSQHPSHLAYAPDAWHPGGRAVACVTNHAVSMFSMPSLALMGALSVPYASAVRFSPVGEWLAVGSSEEGVCIRWDALLERNAS